MQGNAASGAKASLVLSVAAQTTLTTYFDVFGDAAVQFAGGKIMTIGDSWVGSAAGCRFGARASEILTNGGASSALASVGAISFEGVLSLQGGSAYGAGGATLASDEEGPE